MPPKKAPSSLTSSKTLLPTGAALSSSRPPLVAPVLPASDSLASLWTPSSRPRELFPEWPSATALASENWCTPEAPYEDPLSPSELPLPHGVESNAISWKRPSQFLPPISEPTHAQLSSAPSVPLVPEPKAPAKKGGGAAAAPAAAAKKGVTAEPEPVKKPPPKHAHVFYLDPHDPEHGAEHKRGGGIPAAAPATAQVGHAAATLAAHPPVHPITASHPTLATTDLHHFHHIPRDFRRLWSSDELEEIGEWHLEEKRIQVEREARERVYMGFEDAIAYIVNERPRGFAQEEDVDADDLVDDGQDDNDKEQADGAGDAISNDNSPWGILPPSRIQIVPNAICRPEWPHGDVVHGDMASLLRIVEQLFDSWTQSHESVGESQPLPPPAFLWHAIYPQDANGTPIYNPGGKYSVKLFVFGKWRRVDVDDGLPVDAEGNIVYLTSAMKSEIWPALLTKALLKVVHWLDGASGRDEEPRDGAVRMANTVISALTGWKVSRWQLDQSVGKNASESTLQQLLEFIPSSHAPDESSESSGNTGEQLMEIDGESGTSSQSSSAATRQPAAILKPRAVICCGSKTGNSVLHAGEAALVSDIVGDTENTMVKFTSLRGPSSVPEELIAVDRLAFLLIHPPFKHSDLLLQHWPAVKTEATAGNTDDSSHALLWAPFPNPPAQFALLKLPKSPKHEEQPAGDGSAETGSVTIDDHHQLSPPVEIVFTLTRIPPADPLASTNDSRLRSAQELARYVPEMDPNGSLVLIQELQSSNRQQQQKKKKTLPPPMVITLNTMTSTRVLLPGLSDNGGNHVFRVLPQPSLCYGYALQIESREKVDFQDPSTYWRNGCDVQVVNSDGAYPVMLPHSWNVLFKHNVELTMPPAASHDDQQSEHMELFVDLHLSDAMLTPYVHVAVINDATDKVTRLSSLCSKVSLPVTTTTNSNTSNEATSQTFTIIVDCAPQEFHVQEGTWHLTLGSDWLFKASSSHQMKLTTFEGAYEANRPLMCFRDVLTAPKKALWTSFELKLFACDRDNGGEADSDSETSDNVTDNLAVKLQVIDSGSDQLLSECAALKSVRMLQLPRRTSSNGSGDSSDDGGYILQGSIDHSRCVVPSEFLSARPFRNQVGAPPVAAAKAVRESAAKENEDTGGDTENADSAETPTVQSCIKWRLNCWSAEDVKLNVDRTKELQFEAIRASWADAAAKDRNALTSGAVSRLLFLGKGDAAEIRIRHDGVSEELAKRLRARAEWTGSAAAKMTDGVYLEQRVRQRAADVSAGERMKAPKEFQEEDRLLSEEIASSQSQLAQKREDRVAAREQRAQEVRDLVLAIKEQRSASLKKRLKMWQQRNTILASSGGGSTSHSLPTGAS